MKRLLSPLLVAPLLLAARCDPNPDAEYARAYEGCFHGHQGSVCNDGPQVCTASPFELGTYFCTQSCDVDADCEPLAGREVACAVSPEGGVCAVRCEEDSDCPFADDVCEGELGGHRYCSAE